MLQKVRRVVTGHNAAGKAVIMIDDHAPNVTAIKGWPGLGVTEIWVTDEMPVNNAGSTDRSLRPMRHDPTRSGTIFRLVEIPPESADSKIDAGATFGQLGSSNKPSAADSAKHPTMHKTSSIDYLVVVSGSMHMMMEEGEVELHAGDMVVQRGTNHAWINRSGKPCLLAAVLIDATPAPAP
jgi:mannose-6-phosphate isomerase-like protein (cupin superfamily)